MMIPKFFAYAFTISPGLFNSYSLKRRELGSVEVFRKLFLKAQNFKESFLRFISREFIYFERDKVYWKTLNMSDDNRKCTIFSLNYSDVTDDTKLLGIHVDS
ncbi:hypothetical protein WA026_009206 [Henosepilachna vigintioctopunctata]|uniref:Uncharacterized protein n=1 Tax=Henosepilachna vigintioctopunctata TaxID=420089 RepID=A0AAW1UP75_9CUCU